MATPSPTALRETLRSKIQVIEPASLLPHHRRKALLIVPTEVDILDVAEAIASDDTAQVAKLIEDKRVYRPSLAELADWCVDPERRVQFVILQPYVLAQPIEPPAQHLS